MQQSELESIFNPKLFLKEMKALGEIYDIADDYAENVDGLCHNAVAWMLKRMLSLALDDELSQFFLVTGGYRMEFLPGMKLPPLDHSWVEWQTEGGFVVIDLTLAQFTREPGLYVGPRNPKLIEYSRACFADRDSVLDLIFSL